MYWLVVLFFEFWGFFNITARTVTSFRMDTEEPVNEEALEVIAEGDCSSKNGQGFYSILTVCQEHCRGSATQICSQMMAFLHAGKN